MVKEAAQQVLSEGGEVRELVRKMLLQEDNDQTVQLVQKISRMIGNRAQRLSSTTAPNTISQQVVVLGAAMAHFNFRHRSSRLTRCLKPKAR